MLRSRSINLEESECSSQDEDEEKCTEEHQRKISSSSSSPSDDEGYSHSASPDVTEVLPPLQLKTVSDQVIDLYDRMSRIENLIKDVLVEVKSNSSKGSASPVQQGGTLYAIRERIRKISAQV